jgi:hypothetical protein
MKPNLQISTCVEWCSRKCAQNPYTKLENLKYFLPWLCDMAMLYENGNNCGLNNCGFGERFPAHGCNFA